MKPTPAQIKNAMYHVDGVLYWKSPTNYKVKKDSKVGGPAKDGYMRLSFMRQGHMAHHIVWVLEHGCWPDGTLDHIDRNRANNKPSNLRICTNAQNAMNRRAIKEFKGTTFHKQLGKFQAQIKANGKCIYLGLFSTEAQAAMAYDIAAKEMFREFAVTNFQGATA